MLIVGFQELGNS